MSEWIYNAMWGEFKVIKKQISTKIEILKIQTVNFAEQTNQFSCTLRISMEKWIFYILSHPKKRQSRAWSPTEKKVWVDFDSDSSSSASWCFLFEIMDSSWNLSTFLAFGSPPVYSSQPLCRQNLALLTKNHKICVPLFETWLKANRVLLCVRIGKMVYCSYIGTRSTYTDSL